MDKLAIMTKAWHGAGRSGAQASVLRLWAGILTEEYEQSVLPHTLRPCPACPAQGSGHPLPETTAASSPQGHAGGCPFHRLRIPLDEAAKAVGNGFAQGNLDPDC